MKPRPDYLVPWWDGAGMREKHMGNISSVILFPKQGGECAGAGLL